VAHARGSPRRDQVARLEGHEPADIGHELAHVEHHVGRIAVLPALAIDVRPDGEGLRIAHLVGRDQPGTDGTEAVGALALRRGARALHLKGALRHVVDDRVAGDMVERIGLVDVAASRPITAASSTS
jgi:hypothetical protein